MRHSFAQTMLEVGKVDPSLIVLVGDISHGILKPFANEFPDRYYNVGICEPTIVNMASGLSKTGLNPVVHTIAPFLIERSFEQIKLDFEYEKQSVNLVSVGSGFDYSQLGCTHHCYDDLALLSQLPSSSIFVPGTPDEFASMFKENYRKPGIKYYRLSQQQNPFSVEGASGASRVKSGTDVTIVALGTRLSAALQAAEQLTGSVSCDVIYVNQIKPINAELIRESVISTKKLLTVEEHSVLGGVADLCLRELAGFEFSIQMLGVKNFIHSFGTHEELCGIAGVTATDIAAAAKRLMRSSPPGVHRD